MSMKNHTDKNSAPCIIRRKYITRGLNENEEDYKLAHQKTFVINPLFFENKLFYPKPTSLGIIEEKSVLADIHFEARHKQSLSVCSSLCKSKNIKAGPIAKQHLQVHPFEINNNCLCESCRVKKDIFIFNEKIFTSTPPLAGITPPKNMLGGPKEKHRSTTSKKETNLYRRSTNKSNLSPPIIVASLSTMPSSESIKEEYQMLANLLSNTQDELKRLRRQFIECKSLLEILVDKIAVMDQTVSSNADDTVRLQTMKRDISSFVHTLRSVFKGDELKNLGGDGQLKQSKFLKKK